MRRPVLWSLLAVIVSAAFGVRPGYARGGYELIVPGQAIGHVRLGMTPADLERINGRAVCPVTAVYADGRAVRLTTVWGGACQTRGGAQVGVSLAAVVKEFGHPEEVRFETGYAHADAVWAEYPTRGIGFRVLLMRQDHTTLVQTVAVFRSLR